MKYKLIQTVIIACLGFVLITPTENKAEQKNDTKVTIENIVDDQSISDNEDELVPTEIIEEDDVTETKSEEKDKTEIKETETETEIEVETEKETEKEAVKEIPSEKKEEVKETVEQPQENVQEVQTTDSNKTSIGTYKLTAYCPCSKCCGKWAGGNTSSGTIPTQGRTVACNTLPAGTKVNINGHDYIVEDTGNMKGNVVDIFFNSHQEALNFGVQYAEVFVYKN